MKNSRSLVRFPLLLIAVVSFCFALPPAQSVAQVEVGQIAPDSQAALETTAPQLSAKELEALQLRKLERREQITAQVDNNPPSPPGLPLVAGRKTQAAGPPAAAEFHGNPASFVVGRNIFNNNATGARGSTLVEPAAANNGALAFAAGNFSHAEAANFSVNNTWTNVPLPAGPSDAPTLCCDHDVIIDDARRVVFHSTLYINSNATNGVVRIFVRRNIPAASCSFTIDPAGTANNILPDYPHIGLTKRFLYLTINALPTSGTGFAQIRRFNIDQMANCVTTAFTTFSQSFSTFGQRVWVPAEGTNNIETMYWGQLNNTTTFRIFSWPEAAASPSSVTRAISASTFTNPDCRGGVGNFDWIERSTAFSIAGFRLRGAAAPGALGGPGFLAFYWNVGPDAAHRQGHVHAAAFNLFGLGLIAQPHIFNNATCFGFPSVTANKRGDLGLTIGFGGRRGGGGTAARGFVGIDDEFTPGIGFFQTVFLTATGTHNRSDSRFGDYFTIHPYEPCEKWFTATNYSLLNGTAAANVNSRYIEFGRNQSQRCYRAHSDDVPTIPPTQQ